MKTKILQGVSIAVAASTLLSFVGSAEAFTFGTQGIKFDQDTNVDFTFNESHGAYTSALKVFQVLSPTNLQAKKDLLKETKPSDNWDDNGWIGTCGNTVKTCTSSFLFKKNVEYTLGLVSTYFYDSSVKTTVYSTTALNNFGGASQQAVFGSFGTNGKDGTTYNPAPFQSGDPFTAAVKIGFDDRGNGNDKDFQDFTFTAKATQVPEPATLGGLALVVGSLAFARRRTRTAD
jgi:hypothetical protein